MSTRNLDALFAPKAIALVGASNREGSVGAVVARNLLSAGFAGPIGFINAHETHIQGHPCVHTLADLAFAPDLVVLATPAPTVPALIMEAAAKGVRAAIAIPGGFGGTEDGARLRQAMLDAARPTLLRVLGPNCLGFLSAVSKVNASFAHLDAPAGNLALLSQSGAILTTMLDWAAGRGIGFSHIASLGDMADIDFGDLLDFLSSDPSTRAILLYVETVTHARKFMSAARIAARAKPVIVIKAGRSAIGAKAAASHTGALAGADAVYDAAIRRAGMLRVDGIRDLFDAAETLARGVRVQGDRLAIVTNGGGLGVLAADTVAQEGCRLAQLLSETQAALDSVLPASWSHGNPIDIIGDAGPKRYADALEALLASDSQDAVLVINCPTGVADSRAAAEAVAAAHRERPTATLFTCWAGEATAEPSRRGLAEAGLPVYETPSEAVRAFARHVAYAKNQRALLEIPEPAALPAPDAVQRVDAIIDAALAAGRTLLTEPESKRVLAAYGVTTLTTLEAPTPMEAAACAAKIGAPVALKILSPDISHKSDVGGVRLDLRDPQAVQQAAEDMLQRVALAAPTARITGFTVQEMVFKPTGYELLLGAHADPTFGPVIVFGQGGTAVEIIADRGIALCPLNTVLAEDLIDRTRISRLLRGFRDTPPADRGAVVAALMALSHLMTSHARITSLDINPLLTDSRGAIALDARVEVHGDAADPTERLAILPYPRHLEGMLTLDQGAMGLRPIRPEDAPALMDFAQRCTQEDLRMRFHGVLKALTPEFAARLSQIDYDREMAMLACDADDAIAGVARLSFDPDFDRAEFAIIVRSDLQEHGLGRRLIAWIQAYAAKRGASQLVGDVLLENERMLDLARRSGASVELLSGSPGVARVTYRL